MKWDATEPPGPFNFGAGDQIVSHAQARGMQVRGHTLVWHAQQPGWVAGLSGDAPAQRDEQPHHQVATHYKGKIYAWDVVNEAFEDGAAAAAQLDLPAPARQRLHRGGVPHRARRRPDRQALLQRLQHRRRSTRRATRSTTWCGTSSPAACRSTASASSPTSTAQRRPERLPGQPAALRRPRRRRADHRAGHRGLRARRRPAATRTVTNACLAVARCTGITVWGVTDKYSWRASGTPLLFDGNYNKKPAYNAVLTRWRHRSGGGGGGASCTVSYTETMRLEGPLQRPGDRDGRQYRDHQLDQVAR